LIVFVTGATAGFGKAIAQRFIQEGAKVVVAGRRADRLAALAEDFGENVLPVTLDVTDRAAVEAAISGLPSAFAAVDVLVNNAGLALGLEPADRAALSDWETMVDTNVKGLLYVTHALLPGMVARGRGHVVNLGSVAATYPYPGGNVYGATKAFVRQFSLNLRADLVGRGVRVTDIEPGLCGGTEFSTVRFGGDAQKAAGVYDGTQPLTAEDIAEAVYWCAALPPHVNINIMELMPTCQAAGPFNIVRKKGV
jgi:3-hydroxy acid dehydrogenase/malonic semialdehyde reductase